MLSDSGSERNWLGSSVVAELTREVKSTIKNLFEHERDSLRLSLLTKMMIINYS
uniref:Uncharacterized protein n=1 Tax=Tetranychus urticae TaxID=32264 RepID=T1KZD8_TETUR